MRKVVLYQNHLVSYSQIKEWLQPHIQHSEFITCSSQEEFNKIIDEKFISIVICQCKNIENLTFKYQYGHNFSVLLLYGESFSLEDLQLAVDKGLYHCIKVQDSPLFQEQLLVKYNQISLMRLENRVRKVSLSLFEKYSAGLLILRSFKGGMPQIIYANPSYLKFYCKSLKELRSTEMNLSDVYNLPAFNEVEGQKSYVQKCIRKQSATGVVHWFDEHIISIQDGIFNEQLYHLVISHDVTDYKLRGVGSEAESSYLDLEFLKSWTYRMSSDLNNNLEALEVYQKEEESELFESTVDETKVILNDFVRLAKLYARQVPYVPFNFDIRLLLDYWLKTQLSAECKVNLEIDSNLPKYIETDKELLIEWLTTIYKHCKENHLSDIVLRVSHVMGFGGTAEIHLTLVGIGRLALKQMKQAFSWLVVSKPEYATEPIEIAKARLLTQILGGSMTYEVTEKEAHLTLRIAYYLNALQDNEHKLEISKELSDKKILIVDDVEQNILVLHKLLSSWNLNVYTANGGQEAVELAKEHLFDVVLTDLQMPIMSGDEAARVIKKEYAKLDKPHIVVIIGLSSFLFNLDIDIDEKKGLDDFLSKPITQESLYTKLVEYLPTMNRNDNKNSELNNKEYQIINVNKLRTFSGNDPVFMEEVITIFLKRTPEYIQELNRAVSLKDWTQIKQMAHKVKPTFTYVGMEEFTDKVGSIELMANEKDIDTIKKIMQEVWDECQIAFSEFQDLLTSMK